MNIKEKLQSKVLSQGVNGDLGVVMQDVAHCTSLGQAQQVAGQRGRLVAVNVRAELEEGGE